MDQQSLPKALAADMFSLVHKDKMSFYFQGSTDFLVAAKPTYENDTDSEKVQLERILESHESRQRRNAHQAQTSDVLFTAGAHAVPAVPAVQSPTASNVFDPAEKQHITYSMGRHGLEVFFHHFPPPPPAGPTMDVDVVEGTPPWDIGCHPLGR